jgi:hypothetical protein
VFHAAASLSNAERDAHIHRLEMFYQLHNPAKVNTVRTLFNDKGPVIWAMLERKAEYKGKVAPFLQVRGV